MNAMGQTKTAMALDLIWRERKRQEQMKVDGRFRYTCADPAMDTYQKLAVLAEEFGELAREVLTQPKDAERREAFDTEGSREGMLREAIHCAAVSCAWAESLL